MIKEVDFLSSVGEACGAPPLFAFINILKRRLQWQEQLVGLNTKPL
jgi:hypothetical protein